MKTKSEVKAGAWYPPFNSGASYTWVSGPVGA